MSVRQESTLRELRQRLDALEERLRRLEAGRPAPGDGRAAAPRPERPVRRCDGCGLPLRLQGGRCRECGLPLRP